MQPRSTLAVEVDPFSSEAGFDGLSPSLRSLGPEFYDPARRRPDHAAITREVTRLAAAGDWEAVLALSAAPEIADRQPIISLRLHAAAELKRSDIVDEVIARMALPATADKTRFALVSQLIAANYADQAWAILRTVGPGSDEKVLPFLMKIAGRTKNLDVKRAALRLRRSILAPAERRDPQGRTGFPVDPEKPRRPPVSRVTFIAKPHLAAHRDRFVELDAKFCRMLRNPAEPTVRHLKDVYVNPQGQIWDSAGKVIVHHGSAVAVETGADIPVVDRAFNGIERTANFYHWYIDRMGRLAGLPEGGPACRLLLAPDPPSFQRASLNMLGWCDENLLNVRQTVFCRHLLIAERHISTLGQWGRTGSVYDRLTAIAREQVGDREWPKRIYVSRRDSNHRKLDNEAELIERLAGFGFVPLTLSQMSLAEQVESYRHADMVIALHGAGLAHLIVADAGLRVLEFAPMFLHNYELIINMSRLSRCKGHDHTVWLEDWNPVSKRWRLDLDEVERFVDRWVTEIY